MQRSVLLAALVLLPSHLWGGPLPADPVVATINNEAVTAGEYRLIMDRKSAEVFSYMKQHHDLDDHPGYWSASTGSDGPLAKLRTVMLEELIRIKVLQGLAKEKGLIQDTTFAAFQEGFERENARRREAKQLSQVIYGPSQYVMAAYYYILSGDLLYKLKQVLAREFEPEIQDRDVENFYHENKVLYAGKPLPEVRQRVRDVLSAQEAEKKLRTLYATADVKTVNTTLECIVPRVDLPSPEK